MFFGGFLCGCGAVTAAFILVRRRGRTGPRAGRRQRAEWQKNRNFLYYDGTAMPPVKEEKHGG